MPSEENTILDEIATILSGVTSINEIHKEDTDTFAKYPAAVVIWNENRNEMATTTQDLVSFVYAIRVHQEMRQRSEAEADRIIREVIGQIRSALDGNYSLNGKVNMVEPIPAAGGYQTREVGMVRVGEMTLVAKKLINV